MAYVLSADIRDSIQLSFLGLLLVQLPIIKVIAFVEKITDKFRQFDSPSSKFYKILNISHWLSIGDLELFPNSTAEENF